MLHAELHSKLGGATSALERHEDILTSTVFGTLLATGATEVLANWLRAARRLDGHGRPTLDAFSIESGPFEYWFWPHLGGTTPDLVLRCGHRLVVIEAKYRASKSGLAGQLPNEPAIDEDAQQQAMKDQLLREWLACRRDAPMLPAYPRTLLAAIVECEMSLVYLVSSRARATAVKEVLASQQAIAQEAECDAPVWLLTWEQLHSELLGLMRGGQQALWVEELARLLADYRGLGAFGGFVGERLSLLATYQQVQHWGTEWREQRVSHAFAWDGLFAPSAADSIGLLKAWAEGWLRTTRRLWPEDSASLHADAMARVYSTWSFHGQKDGTQA